MTELDRRPGESEADYHVRMVLGKLVNRSLADVDYAELAEPLYGANWSGDSVRKAMYGSLKTIQALMGEDGELLAAKPEAVKPERLPYDEGELAAAKQELAMERVRLRDERNELNKKLRERARAMELNEMIDRAIHRENLCSLPKTDVRSYIAGSNDLLVSLNDIHYGAQVDNYWRKYDSDICAQMMAEYIGRITEIGRAHHSDRVVVWANGDMISGNIHYSLAVSNRENLIDQVMGVSELIAQFLERLSREFHEVKFVSVSGNHSRIAEKDDAIMKERLDDLIGWYLKARLAGYDNIDADFGERIDPSMYLFELRGRTYVGVHGDYDPRPANIQKLQQMVGKPVYAVLTAHMHHNQTNVVDGIRVLMAGSFLGMDEYAVSKRLCGVPQQIISVVDDDGIRCNYEIDFKSR